MVVFQLPKLIARVRFPSLALSFMRKFYIIKLIFLSGLIYSLSGCAVAPVKPAGLGVEGQGVYHKVEPGETVWRIAKTYDVSIEDIIHSNRIPNAAHIEKNQLLFIPGAIQKRAIVEEEPAKAREFGWPINEKIISYFGSQQGSHRNNGIDILAATNDTVYASREGKVVFADYLTGYGYTVIMDHNDGFHTIYTDNAALLVKMDDHISKHEPIARLGDMANRATLHFEIRNNTKPSNPLYYLP